MSDSVPLQRLREICLALPEATEKPFGGHTDPCWRVRDKIFVMSTHGEHGEGRLAVWCKAPPGAQEVLVGSDPDRFFVPPYVGHNGWVGIRLDRAIDWEMLSELIRESYLMTARKRLAAQIAW
jgi:predicted DNA-binding protein (MmcQ/YjbR family)